MAAHSRGTLYPFQGLECALIYKGWNGMGPVSWRSPLGRARGFLPLLTGVLSEYMNAKRRCDFSLLLVRSETLCESEWYGTMGAEGRIRARGSHAKLVSGHLALFVFSRWKQKRVSYALMFLWNGSTYFHVYSQGGSCLIRQAKQKWRKIHLTDFLQRLSQY